MRSGQGGVRRLHRNLLRECNALPVESENLDRKSCQRKPPHKLTTPVYDADESSSDSDGSIDLSGIPLNPNAPIFIPQQNITENDGSDSVVQVENPIDSEPVSISDSPVDSFQSAHSSGRRSSSQDDGEAHDSHEGEVYHNVSDTIETEDDCADRPKRTIKPPRKFTYEQLGKPSYVQTLMADFEIFV